MTYRTYLNRIAEECFRSYLKSGKIVIVSGPRQVGKTTLVKHCTESQRTVFLNFDIEIDKMRFLSAAAVSPKDACASLDNPEILIIDEAQRLPEVSRIIKGWYDSGIAMQIVLLGSSNLDLMSQSAESLTGRNLKIQLCPMLFTEALQSQPWYSPRLQVPHIIDHFQAPLSSFLLQCLAFGSYPEIITTADDKINLLRTLSSDYLYKDVLHSGLIKTPELIRRLLQLLAYQVGREVSVNELARQLQMSRPTIGRYIDLLEQTFVIFRLRAFSTNPRKEISKNSKIYFWDTGIRNALLNAFSTEPFRPDIGAVWENWVIAEIAKHNALQSSPWELFFWRNKSQSEVDLVVKTGTGVHGFEIKWNRKKVTNRSFSASYGTEVHILHSENPFVAEGVDRIVCDK